MCECCGCISVTSNFGCEKRESKLWLDGVRVSWMCVGVMDERVVNDVTECLW